MAEPKLEPWMVIRLRAWAKVMEASFSSPHPEAVKDLNDTAAAIEATLERTDREREALKALEEIAVNYPPGSLAHLTAKRGIRAILAAQEELSEKQGGSSDKHERADRDREREALAIGRWVINEVRKEGKMNPSHWDLYTDGTDLVLESCSISRGMMVVPLHLILAAQEADDDTR